MGQYILSIDQGTTGSTAMVLHLENGQNPKVLAVETTDFKQHYPRPAWVEHDLDEIWQATLASISNGIETARIKDPQFTSSKIAAIGITNQRETTCAWDRRTGRPLAKAIVWQCRRTAEICNDIRNAGSLTEIKQKTGLVIDPYFSGTKMRWLLENNPDVESAGKSGNLMLGTIDTFLLYRLTGGETFKTEPSNASRTMLYDINKDRYDPALLDLMKIPTPDALAEVCPSAHQFGKTKGVPTLDDGIPITGILGDQQAALLGQACLNPGEAKCTYGTGCFLLLNCGQSPIASEHGMLTTVAWKFQDQLTYALEGSCFIGGAAVQFIRDQMHFISSSAASEQSGRDATAAPEVYFVPALAGLGAPYWNPDARGAFLGLTRGTSKEQLVRATLEGIAFQVNDLLESMGKDLGKEIRLLRVDGGASYNPLLMQIQANYSNVPVDRPAIYESTALGAAFAAALGINIIHSPKDIEKMRENDKKFDPQKSFLSSGQGELHKKGWKRAIKAVSVFSEG